MGRWYDVYAGVLKRLSPALAARLDALGAAPQMFLLPWLLTFFSRPLGPEAAARLWDRLLTGGGGEVLRAAVALARLLEPWILPAAAGRGSGEWAAAVAATARAGGEGDDDGVGPPLERVMQLLASPPAPLCNEFVVADAADAVVLTAGEAAALAALEAGM